MRGATYEEKLKEIGMLSLKDRRIQYDLIQAFKIIRGFDDVESDTWFDLVGQDPTRITRHTQDPLNICRKNPRTEIRRNFFSNRVIDTWNNIPSEIKNSRSVAVFKTYVEKKLLNA